MKTVKDVSCLVVELGPCSLLLPLSVLVELAWIPQGWVLWNKEGYPRLGELSWQAEKIPCVHFLERGFTEQEKFLFAVVRIPVRERLSLIAVHVLGRPKMLHIQPGSYHYQMPSVPTPTEPIWFYPLNSGNLAVPCLSTWASVITQST